jgi:multicomponent Na+:H+ antiporter subunit F
MNTLINVCLGMLIIAFALAFLRLIRGASLPSRVVALDLMGTLAVGLITILAIMTGQTIFLDVAVVLALIAFVGTVAFGHYVEKGELPWRRA